MSEGSCHIHTPTTTISLSSQREKTETERKTREEVEGKLANTSVQLREKESQRERSASLVVNQYLPHPPPPLCDRDQREHSGALEAAYHKCSSLLTELGIYIDILQSLPTQCPTGSRYSIVGCLLLQRRQ